MTPHFLNLNQDIVAWSQEGKCVLKYVIHSCRRPERSLRAKDVYLLLVQMKKAVTEWPQTTGSISVLNDAAQEILHLMLAGELMLEE